MRKEWNKIEQTVTQETRSVSRRRRSKIFVPQLLSDLHSLLSEASMNRPSALPARHILSGGGGFYFTWPVPNLRQRDNKRRRTTKGREGGVQKKPGSSCSQRSGREGQEDLFPGEEEEEWEKEVGRRRWGGGGEHEVGLRRQSWRRGNGILRWAQPSAPEEVLLFSPRASSAASSC